MRARAGSGVVVLVVMILGDAASGQTFRRVDHPDAGPNGQTEFRKVDGGRVIGSYRNFDTNRGGAFVYDVAAQTFTPFVHPNALLGELSTRLIDIDGVSMVGEYYDQTHVDHGFLHDGVTFTELQPSGYVSPSSIEAGRVAGTYRLPGGAVVGFIRDVNGTLTPLAFPGAAITDVLGMAGDRLVGVISDGDGDDDFHRSDGFIYDGSTWRLLLDPAAGAPYGGATIPRDISGRRVVGTYRYPGIVFDPRLDRSFLYDVDADTWTPYVAPGASSTSLNGIDGDMIAGSFGLGNENYGIRHAFIATVPEPGAKALVLAVGLAGLVRRRRGEPSPA